VIKVSYSSNNSGGRWWLEDADWKALEAASWDVEWKKDKVGGLGGADEDGRWLGALATEASKDFETMREGVEEWESVVGSDASNEGCNCCGPPHYFSGKNLETGEYVDGPEIRTDSYLEW